MLAAGAGATPAGQRHVGKGRASSEQKPHKLLIIKRFL
jgi:hypothetical protein